MAIKILITINDEKAKKDLQRLNEYDLIEQDMSAINFLTKEFKAFLKDKNQCMKYENTECGLTITWCK